MRYSILFLAVFLAGCSTVVPVVAKFPAGPGVQASTACAELKSLEPTASLSDVTKTVVINYTTYHKCAVKTDAWIEWYQKQKFIYENIK